MIVILGHCHCKDIVSFLLSFPNLVFGYEQRSRKRLVIGQCKSQLCHNVQQEQVKQKYWSAILPLFLCRRKIKVCKKGTEIRTSKICKQLLALEMPLLIKETSPLEGQSFQETQHHCSSTLYLATPSVSAVKHKRIFRHYIDPNIKIKHIETAI